MDGNRLKHFLVTEPYFALVRARDKSEAIALYVADVADDIDGEVEDNIEEIDKTHALILFSRSLQGSWKKWTPEIILGEFEESVSTVLAIDSMLE